MSSSSILDAFPGIVTTPPKHAASPSEAALFVAHRHIGKGSFASVYQMVQIATNRVVVGKFMDLSTMPEANRQFAFAEAKNSSTNSHPNIISFIASYRSDVQPNYLLLVFEFADAGDLSVQVTARAPSRYFKETEILMISAQLCLALHYLHEKNMMHRDIKTQNVFLTTSGLIKIGDFGLSRQYERDIETDVGSTFCGTPFYLAPELWKRTMYSRKADMWSVGVVMYELMALKKPFFAPTMKELVNQVVGGVYAPLPAFYSPELCELVYSLLNVDPSKRPSTMELLTNPLMQSLGLETLKKNLPRLTAVPESTKKALSDAIDAVMLPLTDPPAEDQKRSAP
mmetsp:Transcript_52181/g.59907  ORF Transcript_52181/g.59907 Transcript_52181/m.59907 type:complete len:341 (+) Transcript_52181:142-1164(+)